MNNSPKFIFKLNSLLLSLTKLFIVVLFFKLSACVNQPIIETKRSYDDESAMQYYLTEKKTIEPKIKSNLKQCPAQTGSIQLHWHINRDGKATDIAFTNDTLNCPELNTLLKNHLSGLSFPKPQPLDRVELDYVFNLNGR